MSQRIREKEREMMSVRARRGEQKIYKLTCQIFAVGAQAPMVFNVSQAILVQSQS